MLTVFCPECGKRVALREEQPGVPSSLSIEPHDDSKFLISSDGRSRHASIKCRASGASVTE